MDDSEQGAPIDTARSLALQLLQAEPTGPCSLADIYGDKLAHPLSDRLEELLLHLEKDEVDLPYEPSRRHDEATFPMRHIPDRVGL
jgi:hypothetical protein